MKTLYIIGGTMGVGKTTVSQQLKKELAEANATIASLKNEASRQLEVKSVNVKKQSFPLLYLHPSRQIRFPRIKIKLPITKFMKH